MSDEEQKLRVRLVGRDGRRRYNPGSKKRLVACLEPGVSISGLALAHGISANPLRKWVKDAREAGLSAGSASSPFIPVVAADCSLPVGIRPLDITVADGEEHPASRGKANLSGSSTISACLPNGVKLTLQYGDVDSLTAIIGVLCHVQTER